MFAKLLAAIRSFHPLWRMRKVKAFRTLFDLLDFPIAVRIHGLRQKVAVYVFRNASAYTSHEVFEPSVLKVLDSVLSRQQNLVFWDLGANIGFYTWHISETYPESKIVLFEPDEKNLRLLRKTLKLRNNPNLILDARAASETTGPITFKVDRVSGITGTINQDLETDNERLYGSKESESQTIQGVRLDDLSEYPLPHVMKIDVEGAEVSVLKGAHAMLAKARPIVFIEITDMNVEKIKTQSAELGYTLIKFNDQARCGVCDYVMIPKANERDISLVRSLAVNTEMVTA